MSTISWKRSIASPPRTAATTCSATTRLMSGATAGSAGSTSASAGKDSPCGRVWAIWRRPPEPLPAEAPPRGAHRPRAPRCPDSPCPSRHIPRVQPPIPVPPAVAACLLQLLSRHSGSRPLQGLLLTLLHRRQRADQRGHQHFTTKPFQPQRERHRPPHLGCKLHIVQCGTQLGEPGGHAAPEREASLVPAQQDVLEAKVERWLAEER